MLVLDAEILIRAVLGKRVRQLLTKYAGRVAFFAPDAAFEESENNSPLFLQSVVFQFQIGLAVFESLRNVVQAVRAESYSTFREISEKRLRGPDPADWPVLATALLVRCPIWTDQDFFGTGVATWTTERVELFLEAAEVDFTG